METLYNEKTILNKDENIVTKGDIDHHEQFLLLSQCFQKVSATERHQKTSVIGKD